MKNIKYYNNFIINEKLMNINDDVDFIYDKFFKEECESIRKNGFIMEGFFKSNVIDTSELKCELSKKAHLVNPCKIKINELKSNNNYYNPNEKIIGIGINFDAVNYVIRSGNLLKAQKNLMEEGYIKNSSGIVKEFSESKIKGSINHELVHWMDDSLNNGHVKKTIDFSNKYGTIIDRKGRTRYIQPMEIQSIIHNILQLKREYIKDWDYFTFEEMLSLTPSISSIHDRLNYMEKKEFKKLLIKRMIREDLLGKRMV